MGRGFRWTAGTVAGVSSATERGREGGFLKEGKREGEEVRARWENGKKGSYNSYWLRDCKCMQTHSTTCQTSAHLQQGCEAISILVLLKQRPSLGPGASQH